MSQNDSTNHDSTIAANKASEGIELCVQKRRQRVLLKLSNDVWQKASQPPEHIIKRASSGLQAFVARGEAAFFWCFEAKLQEVWKALRQRFPEGSKHTLTMVLGVASQKLEGFSVSLSDREGALAKVSIVAGKDKLRSWCLDWLQVHVEKLLKESEIYEGYSKAHLAKAFITALEGRCVTDFELPALGSITKTSASERSVSVINDRELDAAFLAVYDFKDLLTPEQINASIKQLVKSVSSSSGQAFDSGPYFEKHVTQQIHWGRHGPAFIGIDMPMVLLLSTKSAPQIDSLKHTTSARKPRAVSISVSPDGLAAILDNIDRSLLPDKEKISVAWLKDIIAKAEINFGVDEDHINMVIDTITKGESPSGLLIAQGVAPIAGQGPYLVDVKDPEFSQRSDQGSDVQNVRRYRGQVTARPGDIVAEIRYSEPAIIGKNVYGKPIFPENTEKLEVTCGEGVKQKEQDTFVATEIGVFCNDEKLGLHLQTTLVHQGDVNLTSGDIFFEGPVEITGNIDHGARVYSGKDIIVHGEVRGAQVKANGSLEVKCGIVAGDTGIIETKGDMLAQFIENSRVICGGHLKVKKSILNSRLVVVGNIDTEDTSGVIAGGVINCGGQVSTGKLGLASGAKTCVHVGVDVNKQRLIERRKARQMLLEKVHEDERKKISELSRIHAKNLSKLQVKEKQSLQNRIAKWKRILALAQSLYEAALATEESPKNIGEIRVSSTLSANCEIKIGKQSVPVNQEIHGVLISSTPDSRGNYLHPIEIKQAKKAS